MWSKVLTLVFAALSVQQILCLTRVEVTSQYKPTLLRLRDVATTKYQEADREYNALHDQVNKNIARSKNITQASINNIKAIITDAIKTQNVTAGTLSCLKNQEGRANALSISNLNYCFYASNSSLLREVKGRFSILSAVALNTVTYCQSLNPLESQTEPYGHCLEDKIPDLNRQINIVESEYEKLSNDTLRYNIQCLTDNAGSTLGQISVISYEISVCFFAPL